MTWQTFLFIALLVYFVFLLFLWSIVSATPRKRRAEHRARQRRREFRQTLLNRRGRV